MEHTITCTKFREQRERVIENWKGRWPRHCRHCLGHTNSDFPCQWCLRRLICPRCGKKGTLDREDAAVPCDYCGWRDGEERDGCPEEYTCVCRVAKAEELERKLVQAETEALRLNAEIRRLRATREKY